MNNPEIIIYFVHRWRAYKLFEKGFHWSQLIAIFLIVLWIYVSKQRFTWSEITLILILAIALGEFINFSSLTRSILIDKTGIYYSLMFGIRRTKIDLDQIKHCCYYETPLGKGDFPNKLAIFLKNNGGQVEQKVKLIRLNFTTDENHAILSEMHKLGLKVLIEKSLKNLEETNEYVP